LQLSANLQYDGTEPFSTEKYQPSEKSGAERGDIRRQPISLDPISTTKGNDTRAFSQIGAPGTTIEERWLCKQF
jgi:hypothetical protein